MGALAEIMGRFYDILYQKVGTPTGGQSALVIDGNTIVLKATRYYPRNFDLSRLPLLSATFGQGVISVNYGRDGDRYELSTTQTVTVWAFINPIMSGSRGTDETLVIAEPLVDALKACFLARTRLQLGSDSDKLNCLTKDIRMVSHSDLTIDTNNNGVISFTFAIEYEEEITRI